MTEQEMNKLADLIVSKVIARQAEYDAQFMAELTKTAGPDYDVTIEYNRGKSVEEQVQELEDQIDNCIKTDNFEAIKPLQDKINKLLNGEN